MQQTAPYQLNMWEKTFDGNTFNEERDSSRLLGQLARVKGLMRDGKWRTLVEIADTISAPGASISARLRDLRKQRFGAYKVERRLRGEPKLGIWEYRMI